MKKLFVNPVILVSLIATLFFMSSCEESADVVDADLIGTWDIGQASVDIKVGPVKLVDFLISTLQFGQEAAKKVVDDLTAEYLDFGSGSITYNKDYSYLLRRNKIEEGGTWKLEGDKLYMKITDQMESDDPLTVQSMSSSAAVFTWEEKRELDLEGTTVNATIVIELNLARK